jgi:Uri superfamily endonuclease
VTEVSRFSRMKFPYVLGVYDYAGSASCSRSRITRYCLPLASKRSAP